MTPATFLPMLLVLAASGMIALQAPTNAILAKAGGSPVLAALISFAVGTFALFLVWLPSGNRPSAQAFAGLPWYAWLGGCMAQHMSQSQPMPHRRSASPR
jgi:transporter family-2 protein